MSSKNPLMLSKKIPNGKLLKLRLTREKTVFSVQIAGDFFLHPEETITALETALLGLATDTPYDALRERLQTVLDHSNAQLIGVSAADIAQLIREGLDNDD